MVEKSLYSKILSFQTILGDERPGQTLSAYDNNIPTGMDE